MRKRRWFAFILAGLLLLAGATPAAFGAAGGTPGYVISAVRSGKTCTLTVSVHGAKAHSGRLALRFDEKALTLNGSGFAAVARQNGVSLTGDNVTEQELVDSAQGYVGFAWYGTVDATQRDIPIAQVRFTMKNSNFDADTFGLRYVPETGFGSWTGAAHMVVDNGTVYPASHEYLKQGALPLEVSFAYPGADKEPAGGETVTITCRDLPGAPVQAKLKINGREYETDENGRVTLKLRQGTYRCLIWADGYGDKYETLPVPTGGAELSVTFVTDEMLVEEARQSLTIGYAEGDSAGRVTKALLLPQTTESGVQVSWSSDSGNVVTREGLVYRPAAGAGDAEVTLTATLTHGAASAEKSFTVIVLAKEATPGENQPGGAVNFQDLEHYGWAKDAIWRLHAAGIIKGTSATTFEPSAPIKRGDFMLLVMNLMAPGAKATGEHFADVPENSYYYNAITAARALGIADGAGGNRFLPQQPITRQEMAVMLARAMRLTGYHTLTAQPGDLSVFTDRDKIARYAQADLAQMVGAGYMVGSGGMLRPTDNASRAEAAVLIDRIRTAAMA